MQTQTETPVGVHILYKKLGETPRECLERFKKEEEGLALERMTYAGRLDPMAEGLLLALSGEAISRKEEFIGLPKSYRTELLWEFETDSLDILGLPAGSDLSIFPKESEVRAAIEGATGSFEQKYPAYSSQTVNGKALIEWARTGRITEIEIPSHTVEIFESQYFSRRFLSGGELLAEIVQRIGLVTGDFRQEAIKTLWCKLLEVNPSRQYALDSFSLSVSSGFYVRQFVSDLGQKLGAPATTFHILRTRVGDFHLPPSCNS